MFLWAMWVTKDSSVKGKGDVYVWMVGSVGSFEGDDGHGNEDDGRCQRYLFLCRSSGGVINRIRKSTKNEYPSLCLSLSLSVALFHRMSIFSVELRSPQRKSQLQKRERSRKQPRKRDRTKKRRFGCWPNQPSNRKRGKRFAHENWLGN